MIEQFKTEKTNQNYAESEKSVEMEEWHRGVQRQLDPECAVGPMVEGFGGQLEGQPGLPAPTTAGEDQQARGRQGLTELNQFSLPSERR